MLLTICPQTRVCAKRKAGNLLPRFGSIGPAEMSVSLKIGVAVVALLSSQPAAALLGERMAYEAFDRLPATRVAVSGGELQVAFGPGELALPRERVVQWVTSAAHAVATYYGRFPATTTRVLIVPQAGRGVRSGKAWAHRGAALRIVLGEQSSVADLERDWVLVHEMTHLAFPSVPDRHHWIEEGLASYVESIARVQSGQLGAQAAWSELVAGMPNGLPRAGDRGLDNTPTWGRTYWGGALFCLLADVEIRRRTGNQFGLQHALRAILGHGNMQSASALAPLLAIGDRAVGVPVLTELYAQMRDQPVEVGLDELWRKLGIEREGRGVRFNDSAPDAAIRRAIMLAPSDATK